jgi:hypothetical protein
MPNENERCDKCRHYFKPPNGQAGCRRFPPQTHFIVVLRQRSQLQPHVMEPREEQRSAFPAVVPDWCCGEFAPNLALAS